MQKIIRTVCLLGALTLAASGCSSGQKPAAQASSNKGRIAAITTYEEFEATQLPVVAAIPARDIYLYGIKPRGAVLYVKNEGHYFAWDYLTPRFVLPKLQAADYDHDGEEELAVVLYTASGTGVAIEELHIVEITGSPNLSSNPADPNFNTPNPEYFADNSFPTEEHVAQLRERIKIRPYRQNGEMAADVVVDGKVYPTIIKELTGGEAEPDKVGEQARMGEIVYFAAAGERLTMQLGLGVSYATYAAPVYIGDVYADVHYSGGKFTVDNLRFEPDKNGM